MIFSSPRLFKNEEVIPVELKKIHIWSPKYLGSFKFFMFNLEHLCPTQAQWPNLAHSVIIFGPRNHIKYGLYCTANTTNPTMLY